MMATDRNRRKIVRGPDADIISNLPDSIIETILMLLPTRDAARTCILSRNWRYRWGKLPQLILDRTILKQSMQMQQLDVRAKFAIIVCQILAHHQGPITTFTLNIPELKSCAEIDGLVNFVSRNGVEEFTLCMSKGESYKLPSSIFLSTNLRNLNLRNCWIRFLPSTFRGFNRLIGLRLINVCISAELLDCIISNCTSLEILELITSNIFEYLNFKAPKLRVLVLSLPVPVEGKSKFGIELFKELPALEFLKMDFRRIKNLVAGGFPTRLTSPLFNLKVLKLYSICLDNVDLFAHTLCLIRGSPNLNTIVICLHTGEIDDHIPIMQHFTFEGYSDMKMNHLHEVKLFNFTGRKSEMELVQLLLAKSPILKKMTIDLFTKSPDEKGLKILKELNEFQRASPNAKVMST